MTKTLVSNAFIVNPDEITEHASILINERGIIEQILRKSLPMVDATVIDATGHVVCPGFINLHVHGGFGYDVMDAQPQALEKIAEFQVRQGVTSFLATTVSAHRERLLEVMATLNQVMASKKNLAGAEIIGVHLEGPYLSPKKSGAQISDVLRTPSLREFWELNEASGKNIRLVTLAPELNGALDFIRQLRREGIVASMGHTNATFDEAIAAIDAGVTYVSHIFNAMPRFNYRSPSALEAALSDSRVVAEVIPDCTSLPHVHPVVIELLIRLKGIDNVIVITDATRAAGMPDGSYELGGLPIIKEKEVVFLKEPWERDRTRTLAGSALTMNRAVTNLVKKVGLSIQQAIRLVTLNPARAIGVDDYKGNVEVGKNADLVVLNKNTLDIEYTLVRGKLVHRKDDR